MSFEVLRSCRYPSSTWIKERFPTAFRHSSALGGADMKALLKPCSQGNGAFLRTIMLRVSLGVLMGILTILSKACVAKCGDVLLQICKGPTACAYKDCL